MELVERHGKRKCGAFNILVKVTYLSVKKHTHFQESLQPMQPL